MPRQTDFVLLLHSHLPYVLNHGRWPHGSDWICEAAIDSYLPLLEKLRALEAGDVAAPVTFGVTPVLANQLAHPTFAAELEAYFAQRLAACAARGDEGGGFPGAVVAFWRARLEALHALWRAIGGDILGELRRLQERGRLELTTSAATHPFLPLLGRDESIRLQLALGRAEHRRLFGADAAGCWLPECGYRPRGMWSPLPGAPPRGVRRGIEEHLADAGFGYSFVDAHMARAGEPLGIYGAMMAGEAERMAGGAAAGAAARRPANSPYRSYRVTPAHSAPGITAFVRDPRSSLRVWSRGEGYPGDGAYLEFHKRAWPEGLRLWRVTARDSSLDDKAGYEPVAARLAAHRHARDFAALLEQVAGTGAAMPGGVIAVPFDTELFGHWWFEGADFLGDLFHQLPRHPRLRPVTAGAHAGSHGARPTLRLGRGSWGRNGDYSMWLNERVAWVWPVIWELEDAFWTLAPRALAHPEHHPVLAQAARSLLLLQGSDWPFIMTTGEVEDYAVRRFHGHAGETRDLLGALEGALAGGDGTAGRALAAALQRRDDVFPDVIPSIAWALADADAATPRPARGSGASLALSSMEES